MALLRRKMVLAAAVETTTGPGTAETLEAADAAMNVYNLEMQPTVDFTERPGQGGTLSPMEGRLGAYSGQASFQVELAGSGNDVSPVPLWASALLTACGFYDNSDTYQLASSFPAASGDVPRTVTLGAYVDGLYKQLHGCMGNAVFTFRPGEVVLVDFTFTGIWSEPTDVALLAPTYPTVKPPRFASGTCTLAASTIYPSEITTDLGNDVQLRPDATKASGLAHAYIANRRITGSMDLEAALVATRNDWSNWTSLAEQALNIVVGSAGGNDITVNAPKIHFTDVQSADRNGLEVNEIAFQANRSADAGDDELTIAFT
jgi:hypothetical protein